MVLGAHQPHSPIIQITGVVYDQQSNTPLSGASISVKGTAEHTKTDSGGRYKIVVSGSESILICNANGFKKQEITVGNKTVININMQRADHQALQEAISEQLNDLYQSQIAGQDRRLKATSYVRSQPTPGANYEPGVVFNTESYSSIHENIFHDPTRKPLSTFSIDVDAASYSNVRRFLRQGQMPPKDAVRIEEMINYFTYDYPQPDGRDPFSVTTELSTAPWNSNHKLLHIGLQGKQVPVENLPSSNLVFLIDVSGSMNSPNKLGLLKSAFRLLVSQLRESDRVSIVVCRGCRYGASTYLRR